MLLEGSRLGLLCRSQVKAGRGREREADLCSFPDSFPPLTGNVTVPVWALLLSLRAHTKHFALSKGIVLFDTISLSCVMFKPVLSQSGSNAKGHL